MLYFVCLVKSATLSGIARIANTFPWQPVRNLRFGDRPRTAENRATNTAIEPLVLDLVDWLAERERTYKQVKHVRRRYHSRLPIWEEATRRGLVMVKIVNGRCVAKPTSLGLILGELRRETRRQYGNRDQVQHPALH
jgi:hypothetical protein